MAKKAKKTAGQKGAKGDLGEQVLNHVEKSMGQQVAEAQREKEIARRLKDHQLVAFGDGVAFTPDSLAAVTSQLAFLARVNAQAIVEIGRRLVWVKEHLADAGGAEAKSFSDWLSESELPFSRRTAFSYMAVARRLAPLAARGGRWAEMPAAKCYELLALPDDEVRELAESGDLRGATADDVDRMTSAELKSLCRRQKARLDEGTEQYRAAKREITDLKIELDRHRHEVNPLFAERVICMMTEMQVFLNRFGKCESEDELIAAAGGRDTAWQALSKVEALASQVIAVSRRVRPGGTVVHVPRGPSTTAELLDGSRAPDTEAE